MGYPRYHTIADLLLATQQPENLIGTGSSYACYRFPTGLGLGDYVLRVPAGDYSATTHFPMKEFTRCTTALTPVPQLIQGANIGQPLLEALYKGAHKCEYPVSILLRQPGTSLEQIRDAVGSSHPHATSFDPVVALAERSSHNPLIRLIDLAVRLHKIDLGPDIHPGNIMLDHTNQQLNLVDQTGGRYAKPSAGNRIPEYIIKGFHSAVVEDWKNLNEVSPTATIPRSSAASYKATHALIDDAKKALNARYRTEPTPPLIFAYLDTTHGVRLDQPPHALVERLRELSTGIETVRA